MWDKIVEIATDLNETIKLKKILKGATINDQSQISEEFLDKIASFTFKGERFLLLIFDFLWDSLNCSEEYWCRINKALEVIKYLINYGSDLCIPKLRRELFKVATLKDFSFVEKNIDKGARIRETANYISEILCSKEKLLEIRRKCEEYRIKVTSKNLNRREAEITELEPKLPKPRENISTFKHQNKCSFEDIFKHMNGANDSERKQIETRSKPLESSCIDNTPISIFTRKYESKICQNSNQIANINNFPIGNSFFEPKNVPPYFCPKKTEKPDKIEIPLENSIKELKEESIHNFETQNSNNNRKVNSNTNKELNEDNFETQSNNNNNNIRKVNTNTDVANNFSSIEDLKKLKNNMIHKKNNNEMNPKNFSFNKKRISFSDLFDDVSDIKIQKKFLTERRICMNDKKKEKIYNSENLKGFSTNDFFMKQNAWSFEFDNKSSKEAISFNQQSTMEIEEIVESEKIDYSLEDSLTNIGDKYILEINPETCSYEDLYNNIL